MPNDLACQNSRAFRIEPHLIPTTNDAVASYESMRGGRLTTNCMFGSDPLSGFPERFEERTRRMHQVLPSTDAVFGQVVNGDHTMFLLAIQTMIDASVDCP